MRKSDLLHNIRVLQHRTTNSNGECKAIYYTIAKKKKILGFIPYWSKITTRKYREGNSTTHITRFDTAEEVYDYINNNLKQLNNIPTKIVEKVDLKEFMRYQEMLKEKQ